LDVIDCSEYFSKLHLLPTTGSMYYSWDKDSNFWKKEYSQNLTSKDTKKIFDSFERVLKDNEFNLPINVAGEQIEHRETQITFSALGQDADLEEKILWDPNQENRKKIISKLLPLLSEYDIHIGGTTSIDVTRKGVNKKWGLETLFKYKNWKKEDVIFIGDALYEGGNDYPVKELGVETFSTNGPKQTEKIINTFIK
jgi:hypothetical protein